MNKSDWRDLKILTAGLIILAGCWIGGLLLTPDTRPEAAPAEIPQAAGRDFPIYWSAWRILNTGENLQDHEVFQTWIKDPLEDSFALHNPPWCLVLFSVLGTIPYPLALPLWLMSQLLLAITAVFVVCRLLEIGRPHPWVLASSLTFLPVITCIYFGQITLLLTVIALSLVFFLEKKRDFLGGGCLALMTLKPHLFFLFVLVIGLEIIFHRRWKLVAGFGLSIAVFFILLQTTHPTAIANWWNWLQSGGAGDWITATIPSWIRLAGLASTGTLIQWPLVMIPGIGIVAVVVLWSRRFFQNRSWLDRYVFLTGLSLILAPYAWSYDMCLLVPWQIVLIVQIRNEKFRENQARSGIISALIIFALIWAGQLALGFKDMHTFIWAPLFISATWLIWGSQASKRPTCEIRNY